MRADGDTAEYEAEAWETGTRHSDETGYHSKAPSGMPRGPASRSHSPRPSFHQSQAGDYYRDTNLTNPQGSTFHGNGSQSNLSHYGGANPFAGGVPQLPFMGFAGTGSVHGSDYGGPMAMPGPIPYQGTGSMYGMMPGAPRNTMMPMGGMGMYGGDVHGSQGGFAPPMAPGIASSLR